MSMSTKEGIDPPLAQITEGIRVGKNRNWTFLDNDVFTIHPTAVIESDESGRDIRLVLW